MSLPRAEELIDINNPFQRNLYTAMKYVLVTLHTASNRAEDYLASSGWSVQARWHYNAPGKWVKKNKGDAPEYGPRATPNKIFNDKMVLESSRSLNKDRWEWVSDESFLPSEPEFASSFQTKFNPFKDPYPTPNNNTPIQLFTSLIPKERGEGNCGDRTQLLAMYLWEHSVGIQRLEGAVFGNVDHEFLIVNRPQGSDINNPDTWGKDTWIIDAWYRNGEKQGIMFSAKDFQNRVTEISNYAKMTYEEMEKYDQPGQRFKSTTTLFSRTNFDIDVVKNIYPYGKYTRPEKENQLDAYQFLSFFDLCRFKYRAEDSAGAAIYFKNC